MAASRRSSIWVTAVLVALVVLMLSAVLTPRLFAHEGVNWGVSVGLAVVAGALVYLVSASRGNAGETTRTPPPR